jgi:hypothetical protein
MVRRGGEQAILNVRVVDAKSAAAELVDMSLKARGLRDDVTVIVVDVLPRAVSLSGSRLGFASTMGCLARSVTLDFCTQHVWLFCSAHCARRSCLGVAKIVLSCIEQE